MIELDACMCCTARRHAEYDTGMQSGSLGCSSSARRSTPCSEAGGGGSAGGEGALGGIGGASGGCGGLGPAYVHADCAMRLMAAWAWLGHSRIKKAWHEVEAHSGPRHD